MDSKIICKTVDTKEDVIELLDTFINNGWDLNKSFIQIVPERPRFHVFYDSRLNKHKYYE